MTTAGSRQEIAELTELLRGYTTHVPPSVNAGGYGLAVDFKKVVSDARRVLAKRSLSASDLRSAIGTFGRFW